MAEQTRPLTEEEHNKWVREQFQTANAYLAEQGLISERILTKDSRYLAPFVALWKFTIKGIEETVWAVTGDFPTDHIDTKIADNPRDALRYFCYRWQMRADKIIERGTAKTEEEQESAQRLIKAAESVFPLTESKELWAED